MLHLKRPPAVAPAPGWFEALASLLGFSRRQSRTFWAALSASNHPELVALRFRCHAHEQYLQSRRVDLLHDGLVLHRFLRTTWTSYVMCRSLERLQREGLLSRAECNIFEGKFLQRTDANGNWTLR